jgi:hypothetical protein
MTIKEKEQQAKLNMLFVATIAIISVILLVGMVATRASAEIKVSDLEIVEQPFDQWIAEQEGTPPPIETSYHYKEEKPWTAWNKFWLASAIVGQAADIGSTVYQLSGDSHCHESNPIGSVPVLAVLKIAAIAGTYWLTEYYDWSSLEERQNVRNVAYGGLAIIGGGAAAYNMRQDCH